jgi:hypothetical protein
MKKTTLIAALIGLGSLSASAQVTVYQNGNTFVGPHPTPQADELTVEANLKFESWTDCYLQLGQTKPLLQPVGVPNPAGEGNPWNGYCLYPETSGMLDIGSQSHRIWDIYANYIYTNKLWYYELVNGSDMRFKENIVKVPRLSDKLDSLNVYNYNYKAEYAAKYDNPQGKNTAKGNAQPHQECGVMAQEVMKVFPHLVETNEEGMYGVNYVGLIPILLETAKEQKAALEKQEILINSLQYQVTQLKGKQDGKTKAREEAVMIADASHLEQNNPNPFTQSTDVHYFVSEKAKTAQILVFDMAGSLLRTYDNVQKGEATLTIEAGQLNAGMYMYSLIVDGVELDSKRMILTK